MTLDEQQNYLADLQASVLTEFDRLHLHENLPWSDEPLDAGDVVWVDFDAIHQNNSSLIKKLRPAVIFQNKHTSEYSSVIMVIPISTAPRAAYDAFYPQITHNLTGTKVEGGLLVNAIQPVTKSAIVEREVYGDAYDYLHTLYPKILRALQKSISPVQHTKGA